MIITWEIPENLEGFLIAYSKTFRIGFHVLVQDEFNVKKSS